MVTTVAEWINALIHWFSILPQNLWAVVLSVVISSLVVQFLKTFVVGKISDYDIGEHKYRLIVRVVAFGIGFVVCYQVWPADVYRVWSSVATALIAPILYKVTMVLVYKRWPDLEAKFSGYLSND